MTSQVNIVKASLLCDEQRARDLMGDSSAIKHCAWCLRWIRRSCSTCPHCDRDT